MSKIGRKPIDLAGAKVTIKNNTVEYQGKVKSGTHILPEQLKAYVEADKLFIQKNDSGKHELSDREINTLWGLHRALISNELKGSQAPFERKLEINGLGFKAALAGQKITLTLGYTHKIDFELPQDVTLEIDKTGQKLTFKSSDKELVGFVTSQIRSFRPPEPYKGTGIKFADETITRKAGKTKSS
ncbi:50S ribosomal protein L6 [Vermiphilus pyriformis]|jgi:large subunit ribosomal protein L6|nr:MAG: 50S ribosomal protein L6 [Vermiphilus pyriformis]